MVMPTVMATATIARLVVQRVMRRMHGTADGGLGAVRENNGGWQRQPEGSEQVSAREDHGSTPECGLRIFNRIQNNGT